MKKKNEPKIEEPTKSDVGNIITPDLFVGKNRLSLNYQNMK